MDLFLKQDFISHSGEQLDFKIECDALTDEDLECLAYLISQKIKFSGVVGVKTGGERLATALFKYETDSDNFLIVDDVLTTGNSMAEMRLIISKEANLNHNEILGVVIFARNKCPEWITPIFQMW